MFEKDLSEKMLEDHNDIFADIVNVLLFGGEKIVEPDDLVSEYTGGLYNDKEKIKGIQRDILKIWKKNNIEFCCIGIENQSSIDLDMPLRIISYDGSAYRKQLNLTSRYPVITMILYFGKEKWEKPLKLSDRIKVNDSIKEYFNDYKINVFDITHLPQSTIERFVSDFGAVADYLKNTLIDKNYHKENDVELKYQDEVYFMLHSITGDHLFLEALKYSKNHPEEKKTMWKPLTESCDSYKALGIAEGKVEGRAEGIEIMSKLISKLSSLGREEDIVKAANDSDFLNKLLKEFSI